MRKNVAIIFAGGVGKRMGQSQIPKQFLSVDEKPIIIHTIDYFEDNDVIDDIIIACVEDWIPHLKKLLKEHSVSKVSVVIPGGETAQDSIYGGLTEARNRYDDDTIVLLHDGVRPFITKKLIADVIASVEEFGSGITCTPCHETIMISEDGIKVGKVPLRKDTFSAQAPQAFRLGDIIAVHDEIRRTNPTYEQMVDACTMYRQLGKDVHMVPGNFGNIKITKPEDVFILEGLINYRKSEERMGLSLLEVERQEGI